MTSTAPECFSFAAALTEEDRRVLRATETTIAWDDADSMIVLISTNQSWATCSALHLAFFSHANLLPYPWAVGLVAR